MTRAADEHGGEEGESNSCGGGRVAPDLLTTVYAHLRAIAQRQMAQERCGHTLQATALVNEVYLRLSRPGGGPWRDEGEFYRTAAEAMRRILIDHARRRRAGKRSPGPGALVIGQVADLAGADPDAVLELDGAILRLEEEEPRAAEVVRLRFYAGLTVEQTAAALELSRSTVLRDWDYARAWLAAALRVEDRP